MSPISLSLIAFACVFGGTFLGMFLRKKLPGHHLSGDTKDVVRLGTGLIGTMAALVLGLLIASANGAYETESSQVKQLTANIVLMRFRKKRPVSISLEEMTRPDEEPKRPTFDIGVPDLRLTGLFDRLNLNAALEELPEGYRSMFLLHDVHGFEHNEIASILGCSVGNSKSQLHKARKRLRELLNEVRHYASHRSAEIAAPSSVPQSSAA